MNALQTWWTAVPQQSRLGYLILALLTVVVVTAMICWAVHDAAHWPRERVEPRVRTRRGGGGAQHGYTLVELMVVIGFLFVVVIGGGVLWVAIHFISKYW